MSKSFEEQMEELENIVEELEKGADCLILASDSMLVLIS